jgi:hypothetical protein
MRISPSVLAVCLLSAVAESRIGQNADLQTAVQSAGRYLVRPDSRKNLPCISNAVTASALW